MKSDNARVICRKIYNKLTPSGYRDNGVKYISDRIISFPLDKLRTAIIEEIECVGIKGIHAKVTIDGVAYSVEMIPPLKKIMTSGKSFDS